MPRKLKGKCAYYLKKQYCLGCERLAYKDFEGDDNCPYILEREELERNSWFKKENK